MGQEIMECAAGLMGKCICTDFILDKRSKKCLFPIFCSVKSLLCTSKQFPL